MEWVCGVTNIDPGAKICPFYGQNHPPGCSSKPVAQLRKMTVFDTNHRKVVDWHQASRSGASGPTQTGTPHSHSPTVGRKGGFMTTMVIALDLTNTEHAQALAQFIVLATQIGAQFQVGVGAAQADAPAPAPAPQREYEPTHDVVLRLVVDKAHVTYTAVNGGYVGESGIRKALNARIRKAGGVWDDERKAYKFPSPEAAQEYATSETIEASKASDEAVEAIGAGAHDVAVVTAEQWQAQRDRAAAKAARKG